jgi:AcrR family transcriptional regulator
MPRKVDHDERRREIAGAVGRIAERKGLARVSFREVAAEAGMSVSLVQHYVDTKENLLVHTLNHTSATVAEGIASQISALGEDAGPFDRIAAILEAFLPRDHGSRAAMQVYLQFASAAMADPVLRSADAFANGHALIDVLAAELAGIASIDMLAPDVDPPVEARALLSLVLGLSIGMLLDQTTPEQALAVLQAHLSRLRSPHDE